MRTNRKLLLGIALIVVGIVTFALYSVLSRPSASPPPETAATTNGAPAQTVSLRGNMRAVAVEDIPARSIVTANMFVMMPLESPDAPADSYIGNPESQAIGFITKRPIKVHSTLVPADFIGHISDVGIAGALQPGMRALVVAVANKPTLHDLVRIGDNVDIIAAFDGQESRSIVQNVRVLAVDVFAKDYPVVNAAQRNAYKAEPKGKGPVAPQPGQPAPDPNATPTPTPVPGQPPPRPDPALTIEVSPVQANSILLAQSSGATLDFILRPTVEDKMTQGAIGPDGNPIAAEDTTTPVSITRAKLAPYAESKKTAKAASGRGSGSGGGGGPSPRNWGPPPISGTPAVGTFPVPPSTYDIPIYADGKMMRVDTVRKPE